MSKGVWREGDLKVIEIVYKGKVIKPEIKPEKKEQKQSKKD